MCIETASLTGSVCKEKKQRNALELQTYTFRVNENEGICVI